MSNPCMVLDVTEHDQWAPFRGCHRIPEDCRPTVLHPSREVAEQEALRLAPGGESLLPDLYRVMSGWENECLEGLSPEDRKGYQRLSGTVISNLMRMNEESRGPAANKED